jgi:hypothetical protein
MKRGAVRVLRCIGVAVFLLTCSAPVAALALEPSSVRIAFVPLDDRPATERFPQEVAAICGTHLELPPQELLGHFTRPGDADGVGRWLLGLDTNGLTAVVISTDMLVYGGLVASRTADTSLGTALYRLRPIVQFHRAHPEVPIYAFATVMRLAPTATASSEPYLEALEHYAQLAAVATPTRAESDALAISRSHIPDSVFWDYIGTRARDLAVDKRLAVMASDGDFASLAITQDDAGAATGLQVPDEAALHGLVSGLGLQDRVLLNPGADEMGMVMVMRAIEDAVHWSPSIAIVYPSATSARQSDPLEYTAIGSTVGQLAAFLRVTGSDTPASEAPAPELAVFTPDVPDARREFFDGIVARLTTGRPTAIADLSFLTNDAEDQTYAVGALEAAGVADKPLAYASWNTTANTVGTALAESVATLLGEHFDAVDRSRAATFLFDRYVDDYGYRLVVRPQLQAQLRADDEDVDELGDGANAAESQMRSMLWPIAVSLWNESFASDGWRADRIGLYLPWQRTFEVQVDASLMR